MKKIKIITFIILCNLISCKSNDEKVKLHFIDKELKLKIESYIDDAVDNFSNEIENEGGFFMWKNYKDFLGFSETGFSEKIQNKWNNAYDNETLELYINSELAKNQVKSSIDIDKSVSEIKNYNFILLFPFISIIMEELLLYLILFLILEFVVIPYIAKITLPKEYRVNGFWTTLLVNFLSNAERQNRINLKVAKIRNRINYFLIFVMVFLTLFYFDFNESLNHTLKTNIKNNILENINFKISEQLTKKN